MQGSKVRLIVGRFSLKKSLNIFLVLALILLITSKEEYFSKNNKQDESKAKINSNNKKDNSNKKHTKTLPFSTSQPTSSQSTKKPEPPKHQAIVIVTEWRSGSSFFGDIFNSNSDFFYIFEPLLTSPRHLHTEALHCTHAHNINLLHTSDLKTI